MTQNHWMFIYIYEESLVLEEYRHREISSRITKLYHGAKGYNHNMALQTFIKNEDKIDNSYFYSAPIRTYLTAFLYIYLKKNVEFNPVPPAKESKYSKPFRLNVPRLSKVIGINFKTIYNSIKELISFELIIQANGIKQKNLYQLLNDHFIAYFNNHFQMFYSPEDKEKKLLYYSQALNDDEINIIETYRKKLLQKRLAELKMIKKSYFNNDNLKVIINNCKQPINLYLLTFKFDCTVTLYLYLYLKNLVGFDLRDYMRVPSVATEVMDVILSDPSWSDYEKSRPFVFNSSLAAKALSAGRMTIRNAFRELSAVGLCEATLAPYSRVRKKRKYYKLINDHYLIPYNAKFYRVFCRYNILQGLFVKQNQLLLDK